MKTRAYFPLLAAGLALASLPATADERILSGSELFTIFQAICIDHQGDLEGARTAALQLGLATPRGGPPVVSTPSPSADVGPKQTLYAPGGAGTFRWFVVLESGDNIEGAEGSSCQLEAGDQDRSLFTAALNWPGFASPPRDRNFVSFTYRQTANGRVLLDRQRDRAELAGLARSGELREYYISTGSISTKIMLATPLPRTK